MARHVSHWESEMIDNLFEDEGRLQAPMPDAGARSMSHDLRRCFRTFIPESGASEWRWVKTLAGTGDLPIRRDVAPPGEADDIMDDDDTSLYVYSWSHSIALRTYQSLITLNKGDVLVYRGDLPFGLDSRQTTAVIDDPFCLDWNCTFTGKGTMAMRRHLYRFHHFRFQHPPHPVTP
ncbi:hypothetical protein JG688_00014895 [Phytophthora aleatoria]|uniref:Uncharacterized protein n=1 Tax=Phytophthora aleatoria TaxID=2496075 RepID=A0A8J5IGJ2_9STRA|nr:hypothetical protein JG688_00014895 [Phytophthora aleatoria]